MGLRTGMRLAVVAMATAGTLVVGGTAAVADPPPGWAPTGPNSVQYDSGWLVWSHHGRYADAPGNWHTGFVSVEESDDGLTGDLFDWRCPRGVKPLPADNPFPSPCTLLRARGISNQMQPDPVDGMTLGVFDQARNRLTIHHDISAWDWDSSTRLGTVRIDVTMQGRGRPETTTDTSNGELNYWERFPRGRSWGTVDGHRVHGHHTRQYNFSIGFEAANWERIR